VLQTKSKKQFIPILMFFFFFFIFLSSSGGHTDHTDGFVYFLMTENVVMKGSPTLNVNSPTALDFDFNVEKKIITKTWIMANHDYTKNPDPDLSKEEYITKAMENANREEFVGPFYVVLPLVAVPLYEIAELLGFYPYTFVSLFLNSIIIALICVVVFFFGRSVFGSDKIGFVLALIFGVTSFIWPYNSSMFARPLAILFLMLSIYLIHKNNKDGIIAPFLSAVFIGLSVLTHTFFLLYFPGLLIFGLYSFKKDKKKIIAFIVGIVIIISIIALINYVRFNDPIDFGVGTAQEGSEIGNTEGLYAYLISPGRSIFLFFPIALLFPLGIYYLFKKDKLLSAIIVYLVLVSYLYIGLASNWNTSMNWGPHRYLLPIIPLIVISIGSLMINPSTKLRGLIISLSVVGFFINLNAALVWDRFEMAYSRGVATKLGLIENYLDVKVWVPSFSPIKTNFEILITNYVGKVTEVPNITKSSFKNLVVPGCNFDVYVYCKLGIVPVILLGILIAILGFLILYFLGVIGNKKMMKTKTP